MATIIAIMKIANLVFVTLLSLGCARHEVPKAIRESADEEMNNAAKLLTNGLNDQAEAIINARLAKKPEDSTAYVLLGASELMKQDFTKATNPYFESAIKIRPQLKEELFDFLALFGRFKECSIFGVEFPEVNEQGIEEREHLIWWMMQTDKAFAMSRVEPAFALASIGLTEVEEFLKRFPETDREVELRVALLEFMWNEAEGDYAHIPGHVKKVLAVAPKGSDAEKRAREILAETEAIEAEIAADEKRLLEREIIGVWEPVASGFAAYLEFGDDGMYSVGLGALKETNRYEVNGNTLRIWSKNFVNGEPYPPSTVTWTVSGTKLSLRGGGMDGEYRRR